MPRGGERRVEPAEWAPPGDPVFHHPDPSRLMSGGRSTDKQNVIGNRRQLVKLTVQNRPAADHERALVATTESRGKAAAEDCRAEHVKILLLG